MLKSFLLKQLLTFLVLSAVVLFQPVQVAAQTSSWSGVCVESVTTGRGTFQVATIQGLQCLLANILSTALTFIGLAGFVMMVVGAFRYMLSGGNSKETEAARNTLTFVVVGLITALSAFIIINIIAQFTGVNLIKNFFVPSSEQTY